MELQPRPSAAIYRRIGLPPSQSHLVIRPSPSSTPESEINTASSASGTSVSQCCSIALCLSVLLSRCAFQCCSRAVPLSAALALYVCTSNGTYFFQLPFQVYILLLQRRVVAAAFPDPRAQSHGCCCHLGIPLREHLGCRCFRGS